MKKYITIFSLIALFFTGTQLSNAQERRGEQQSPEAIAKTKTHQIHELVQLTGDQQREIYNLLLDSLSNEAAMISRNMNVKATQEAKSEIMNNTNTRLKSILNPEQYAIYMKSLEKEEKVKK